MSTWTMVALLVPTAIYSVLYHPLFILQLLGYALLGMVLEGIYFFLKDGTIRFNSISSGLTAALLAASVPPTVPFLPMLFSLIVAIWLVKLPCHGSALRFNAAMAGRLFLMLAYSSAAVDWGTPTWPDVISCATPQELYSNEGATLALKPLLFGWIGGAWEGLFQIVPGSPGETWPPVLMVLGVVLCFRGIVAWRIPVAFLLSFAASSAVLGDPPLYNLLTSATMFSAVFIVSDPVSTPMSKSGKWIVGIIIGVSNALIRHYTYYTEAIVFAVLIGNLFTPLLDRIAFSLQGWRLQRRKL
jgi:Na+-translocating ferredoxin:NAD+ oxidoreductase RnfD subunit